MLVFVVLFGLYMAVTHLTPPRIGCRIGFWVCALGAGVNVLKAMWAAMGHHWLSLIAHAFLSLCCGLGAWAWAGDLRRERNKAGASC